MRGLVIACLCRVGGCWLSRGLVAAFTPRVWCYDTISRPIVQCMETRSRPEILIAAYVLVFNLQFLCSVISTLSFMLAVAQVYLNHLNDDCLLRRILVIRVGHISSQYRQPGSSKLHSYHKMSFIFCYSRSPDSEQPVVGTCICVTNVRLCTRL